MSFEDWNKYFEEVFGGAWDCYSDSSDTAYKQWIRKGARWATDFHQKVLEENKAQQKEIDRLKKQVEVAREALISISDRRVLKAHHARETLEKLKELEK